MSQSLLSPEAEIARARSSGGLLGEAALSLYGAAGHVAAPVAGAFLKWRGRQGKEDVGRRGERFGITHRARPAGPLDLGACGERRRNAGGAAARRSAGGARRDHPADDRHGDSRGGRGPASAEAGDPSIRADRHAGRRSMRFLDHWRPGLVLFAESEFWPTILRALERRGVPLVVINARMSDRSFRAWRAFSPVARAILERVGAVPGADAGRRGAAPPARGRTRDGFAAT